MNSNGVYDSLGSLQLFFTSGIISAIYSAILFAAGALPPVDGVVAQTNPQTTKYIQGCYQLVGMCISIGIGAFFGALIGLLAWVINKDTSKD